MKLLEKSLSYSFNNKTLLKQALVHRSVSKNNNERLEFLGDGCLNFIVGEALYKQFPNANEGELSNLRAHLVKEDTLVEIANSLQLHQYIALSHGERKSDGAKRSSILSDTLEAIIGAIFLDSSFERVKTITLMLYNPYFESMKHTSINEVNQYVKDPKSKLQEKLQALNKEVPTYEVLEVTGEEHAQCFTIICRFEHLTSIAKGTSKKRAEQKAAQLMLDKIQ